MKQHSFKANNLNVNNISIPRKMSNKTSKRPQSKISKRGGTRPRSRFDKRTQKTELATDKVERTPSDPKNTNSEIIETEGEISEDLIHFEDLADDVIERLNLGSVDALNDLKKQFRDDVREMKMNYAKSQIKIETVIEEMRHETKLKIREQVDAKQLIDEFYNFKNNQFKQFSDRISQEFEKLKENINNI